MTAAQLAQKMAARAQALDGSVAGALQQAGEEALAAGLETMETKIYSHPIPTTKSGKPKWKQTRALLRGEKLKVDRRTMTARIVNDVIYARHRHELGTAGKSPTPWPAHWRDEAIARAKEQFSGRIARAIRSVWERP